MATSCKECFTQALETSTVIGVPRAYKEKNTCLKCFWFFAIALFITLMVYSIILLIIVYLQYGTLMNINQLPAESWSRDFLVCTPNPSSSAPTVEVMSFEQYQSKVKGQLKGKNVSDGMFTQMLSHEAYLLSIGQDNAAKLNPAVAEIVVSCAAIVEGALYDSTFPCSKIYKQKVLQHPKHVSCVHLELNADEVSIKSIQIKGNLDRKKKPLSYASPAKDPGLFIAFHKAPKESAHKMWGDAITAPAGKFTKADVKSTVYKRLAAPFGACGEPDACQKCVNDMSKRSCDCSMLPGVENGTDPCLKLHDDPAVTTSRLRCVDSLPIQSSCHCPQPCEETTYSALTTIYPWSKGHQLAFYAQNLKGKQWNQNYSSYDRIIEKIDAGLTDEAEEALNEMTLIEQNFASVELTFEAMQTVMEQAAAVELADLGPPIGGLLSLAGLSLVCFLEIFDFLIKLCMAACCKRKVEDNYGVKQ